MRMKTNRATLFRNGGSQAVRLPLAFRFPEGDSEVLVRRVGRRVVLEPLDVWPSSFLRVLGSLSDGIERPAHVPLSQLRDPFE